MNTEDLPQRVEKFVKMVATVPESGMIEAAKAREVIEAGANALLVATTLNGLCRDTILRLCVEKDQLQAENVRLKRLLASGAHSDILANA